MRSGSDPVGYRRGLVLGLTLAETLLLVLFILLLVYAALGQERDKKLKAQEAQIAGLSLRIDSGLDRLAKELTAAGIADPSELSLRLSRLTEEMARNGRIVYIYDALLLDDGLRLSVNDDRTGLDMAGLEANGAEPKLGQTISRQAFLASTRGLHAWSVTQGCRFYARIIDGTSAGNKSGYIQARRTVEDRFYPLVASASAGATP